MPLDDSKPIIKKFTIFGLYGYKNVSIDFDNKARIIIAENGAGKTTILSALHSFLTGNFYGLRTLDFESITCKFSNDEEELVLNKKDLTDSTLSINDSLEQIASISELDKPSIVNFLTTEFDPENSLVTRNSAIATQIYMESPWNWEELHEILGNAYEEIHSFNNEEIQKISKKIKEKIGDKEILYLPTYRRIEKLFEKDQGDIKNNLFRKSSNRLTTKSSAMNYGLSDVEERLASLTDEIQRKTNLGYRTISANIINDLLTGKATNSKLDFSDLPSLETLKLFFSRVGGSKGEIESHLSRIQEIYDSKSNDSQNNTLLYFLSKLSLVVDQTKQLEKTIEVFVSKCNTYLGNTSDSKSLNYDAEKMKVSVVNQWSDREIKLNDLSSGEKQVISLLSYLFLYPSEKIILIDEPELSLSIDWQEKIVIDMATAPSCRQLLAITHSPFIFNNELDPYSAPLKIEKFKKEVF